MEVRGEEEVSCVMDCLGRKCMTVLHGEVCRHTPTPHWDEGEEEELLSLGFPYFKYPATQTF